MIYKPSAVARMWDTWLYYHEGKHYLFYLHNTRADVRWDGMSVAVSDDGVHFDDHGPIIYKADDAVWLGTGMVWRAGGKVHAQLLRGARRCTGDLFCRVR